MKRDVFLNHASIITGLGNLDLTWKSILDGKSGIIKKEHFNNSLLPQTGLSLYKREMDGPAQNLTMKLMSECAAGLPELPGDTFVIWTGIKNDVEAVEALYNDGHEVSCKNAYEMRLALMEMLGLDNGGMEINAACASSTAGAGLAAQFIADGKYDHVLVAGSDIVSRFVYFGFAALKAMNENTCMPFDVNRSSLTLGDGAAALFLSAGRQSDIRISGYGITNDANHITGPSRDGSGLSAALLETLDMAGIEPGDVGAFCAHGTGTRYNDSMELAAAAKVFGPGHMPPVFGVKGSTGHTLGAAGGIEIALCGKSLLDGIMPPTVGCLQPEIAEINLEKALLKGRNILTSNSGFGGINAAILMENIS
ncbi:MAG: beta-ketoacyl synthase N-terminal-like domain-containing protein [Brevinematales bacterium]|jgi:3-oxoacyl-[acyl-carrier-protein] synthase II